MCKTENKQIVSKLTNYVNPITNYWLCNNQDFSFLTSSDSLEPSINGLFVLMRVVFIMGISAQFAFQVCENLAYYTIIIFQATLLQVLEYHVEWLEEIGFSHSQVITN